MFLFKKKTNTKWDSVGPKHTYICYEKFQRDDLNIKSVTMFNYIFRDILKI